MCHEQWALTVIKRLRFFVLINTYIHSRHGHARGDVTGMMARPPLFPPPRRRRRRKTSISLRRKQLLHQQLGQQQVHMITDQRHRPYVTDGY